MRFIKDHEIDLIISGMTHEPHHFLGMHDLGEGKGLVVRAWDPTAHEVKVKNLANGKSRRMECLSREGFFECHFPSESTPFRYSLHSIYQDGFRDWSDPYSFLPAIENDDFRAFNEGVERRPYQKLGAISLAHQGTEGVAFTVWAPSAISIHLVGDFNHWNDRSLPMRNLGSSGCWELFVPFAQKGDKYKFRVLGADHVLREKTDPFGWLFEALPGNASIIGDRSAARSSCLTACGRPCSVPVSIYEMHLGSWRLHPSQTRPLNYIELADQLPAYLEKLGFTHVEFLPLSEYPFGASWGYQVTGYYSSTHRYGSPEDFCFLVQKLQESGIGVIIDWVPAHFPSDEFALARFDGTCLFEHQDPKQGMHAEWGTLCFNYGRAEVRSFLIGSAIAWLDRFGVDGFRVDAVASMLYLDYARKEGEWCPNIFGGNENLEAIDFIKQFNDAIHQEYPNIMSIAEESTSFPQITKPPATGGLGFDLKWNMGWMHDVLGYFSTEPVYRSYKHNQLTFGAMYQFSENFVQAFSHDEVVHGKGSLVNKMNLGNQEDRIANLRALYALQWTWPGKKTLFMGCEMGQWGEWNFESELDWALLDFPNHEGIGFLIRDLNKLYKTHPTWALVDHIGDKFQWIDCNDANGQTLSFLKFGQYPEDTLMIACNFSDSLTHKDWGCPHKGDWHVILDTDSPFYCGEGAAGGTLFKATSNPEGNQPYGLSFAVNRWSVRILSMNKI
jgi:1,4-alpha-glucan branching enzyme